MRLRILMVIAAAGLLLASCTKEQDGGRLRIKLQTDPTVSEQATRALVLEEPGMEDFNLNIVSSDGEFDENWIFSEYEGASYMLAAGSYRAIVTCGDPEIEGIGKPAFGTEGFFTIYDGQTANATLTAKLVNMAATIVYESDFKNYFSKYHAVITTASETEISFENESATAVAFLKAEPFKVTVYYERSNGKSGSFDFTVSDGIEVCKHINMEVDVEGGVGSVSIVVSFDDHVERIPVEIEMID